MARGKRYYLEGDTVSVTPSQLKRLGRQKQMDFIKAWFHTYHEDPNNEMPRDEGEFIFPWGGPYDANEAIQDEFGGILDYERMEPAIREIQSDGIVDWAPTSQHPDYRASFDDDDDDDDRPEETPVEAALAELLRRLHRGEEIRYGTEEELQDRRAILDRLDGIEAALADLRSRPPGIGHNGGPADDEGDEPGSTVEDAIAAVGKIRSELVKPEPDAEAVVVAASRLARFGKWMRDRWNKGVERAVEAPITAAILAPLGVLAAVAAPEVMPLLDQATEAVVRWAQAAMSLF